MTHRPSPLSIIVLLCTALSAGCDDSSASASADPDDPSPASWLVSMTGASADLSIPASGDGQVVLYGASNIVAFTDRPARVATSLDPQFLVDIWGESFADSAPNAEITGFVMEDTGTATVMSARSATIELLGAPVYDEMADSFTFDVRLIDSDSADDLSSTTWSESSLFIDSWWDCIGMVPACIGLAAVVGIEVYALVQDPGAVADAAREIVTLDTALYHGCMYEVCACFHASGSACREAGYDD